ncbi:MAG: hypothetical protein WCO11_04970 [Sphingomonadales bacterium]|jgi:hypothetical protein
MIGIALVAALNIAMFAWFSYLFAKDPANVFKHRRRRAEDHDPSNGQG